MAAIRRVLIRLRCKLGWHPDCHHNRWSVGYGMHVEQKGERIWCKHCGKNIVYWGYDGSPRPRR